MSIPRKKQGFTLIELLIVMTILLTVGGVVVSLLSITLRGSNKAQAIAKVQENGSFALTQMVNSIRFAKQLNDPLSCIPSASVSAVTVTSLSDNGQTTFSCPVSQTDGISSNSASLIDTSAVSVSSCSFVCTQSDVSQAPEITIQFSLTAKSQNNLFDSISTIPFQSSVLMRNLEQNN